MLAEAGLTYCEYYQALLEQQRNILTTGCDRGIMLRQSQLINEIHDELTLDLCPDNMKRDIEIIIETMRAVPSLHILLPGFDVPLDVEAKIGNHWTEGEQIINTSM